MIKPLEPASIMVRLVDQQRGATASHPFPPNSDGENLKIPSEYTDMMVRFGSLSLGVIRVWGVVHRASSKHRPLHGSFLHTLSHETKPKTRDPKPHNQVRHRHECRCEPNPETLKPETPNPQPHNQVRHWPESMDERFDEHKTAAFWNLQKGLFEGRIKPFKETHIPPPKKRGAISGVDEAGLIEGLRKNLTSITGIETVDVPASAHAVA
jgi:hypothetical protein